MRASPAAGARRKATPTFDIFEILLILIVALVVLGPEQLPGVLRAAGKILRELRSASNQVMRELTDALEEDPAATTIKRPTPPNNPESGEPRDKP